MSMPTGEGAQGGANGAPSGTEATSGTTQPATTETGTPSGTTTETASGSETVSRQEFEQLRRQLQAADQNRSKAEAELKKLQDAALSEEEKRKQALEQAQKDLAEREEAIKDLKIQNAFLNDNTHDWHDPRAALKLADLSAVTIDGEKVTGLKEALKAVADAHPYLLKPKAEGAASGTASTGAATGVAGRPGNAGDGAANKADLEKRFPAMRGRVT